MPPRKPRRPAGDGTAYSRNDALSASLCYATHELPACVGSHTDHFIPIVYGFPTQRTLHRVKQGKLYLGGCEVSGCDPHYYCPIHRKEL